MKVAVIGSNGQLGSDLCEVLSPTHELVSLTHKDIDIADIKSVKATLGSIKAHVVINTAAYHNVPKCEYNIATAFDVNGIGSFNLAQCSNELGYKLVHYSTDYVFDGEKKAPYVEDDIPNPLNSYAITKLAGEYFVKNYCDRYFIIRVSGIYGRTPCRAKGDNFITTMIRLAQEKPLVRVVNDEILTPSPTKEIALNTLSLIETEAYGLYHMSCEGECSWYEFAQTIFETLNLKTPLEPTTVKEFSSPVKRPFYSVLENNNLKKNNLNQMRFWKDSLIDFLKSC